MKKLVLTFGLVAMSLGFSNIGSDVQAQIRNTDTSAANTYPADSLRAQANTRMNNNGPDMQRAPGATTNMAPPGQNIQNNQLRIRTTQPNDPRNNGLNSGLNNGLNNESVTLGNTTQNTQNEAAVSVGEQSIRINNANGEPIIQVSPVPEGQMLTPPDTLPTAQGVLPDDPGKSATVPADPNTSEPGINTPIYSDEGTLRELAVEQETLQNLTAAEKQELARLRIEQRNTTDTTVQTVAESDDNDMEESSATLTLTLWLCAALAVAAGGYYIYQRNESFG